MTSEGQVNMFGCPPSDHREFSSLIESSGFRNGIINSKLISLEPSSPIDLFVVTVERNLVVEMTVLSDTSYPFSTAPFSDMLDH